MMDRAHFFAICNDRLGPVFANGMKQKLIWAYDFAKLILVLQKRDSGERSFDHSRGVALIILENCRDPGEMEIAIALLHDVIEDGTIDPNFLVPVFGESITEGILTLSKKIPHYAESDGSLLEEERRSDKKYFTDIAAAPRRIRRVKTADRIHNISDMRIWSDERKRKYIAETREYVLPIARETDRTLYHMLLKATREAESSLNKNSPS